MVVSTIQSHGGTLRKCDWGTRNPVAPLHKNHGVTHHGGGNRPYLPNYWELDLPPAATTPPGPNAIIRYTAGVIAASASADFAPSSPSPPNTNISGSSISAGCHSSNTASTSTPQNSTTCDDNGEGITPVSG
eukprot:scaffold69111_cov80-Cyclotella_meneghiniana.AAC.1